jgi:SpoVK/Ycf46/Vps4 family AAA+-type ATPase
VRTVATAEQLKALVRSFGAGDQATFMSVAMQVAAYAARQGHGKLAEELRALIDEAKSRGVVALRRNEPPTPLVQPRGELAGILSVEYPATRLGEMVLEASIRRKLDRVLREHRQAAKLHAHGLAPRRRLLLVGPPGSGKTMTAAALAGEMSLPLFTIQLDGVITKFMGETAAKLRIVFDAIRATRGVYLFDEFDAIGGRRTASNDVGEIRRVLNSFLLFLEQERSDSVLIAATNHPDLLDRALFRRFDDVIEYGTPAGASIDRAVRAKLGAFDVAGLGWKRIRAAARGLSYAEITKACEDALKETVLVDSCKASTQSLLTAFAERRRARRR